MLGYTVPLYQRLTARSLGDYQRYYCETCHQLKAQFGLLSTATVNYDMTFNTIVLNAVTGGDDSFEKTPKSIRCVFRKPYTDQEMFRRMAAYTILITKWELYDDICDKPSMKTRLIDTVLSRAITKAETEFPEYDRIVGEGFEQLRTFEADGCTDPVKMGRAFGEALARPLSDIAGDHDFPALRDLYANLTTAVYVMDAIDDIEDDFMDGTYNPFLRSCPRFVNRAEYMAQSESQLTELVNNVMRDLQESYRAVRERMAFMTEVTDNIIYLGIPESAKNAVAGRSEAKMSVKNLLERRKERTSTY
ncbi:MAG: DUF5685 family protein [archaeon]|nr:DUF5685 family protein [archaeon]